MASTPLPLRLMLPHWLLAVAALMVLGGCQPGRVYVLDRPGPMRADGVSSSQPELPPPVVQLHEQPEDRDSIEVSGAWRGEFRALLEEQLAKAGVRVVDHDREPTIRVDYRFVGLDPGNHAVRVGAAIVGLVGVPTGALGGGTLAVDTQLHWTGNNGEPFAARFLADGPIDGPFTTVHGGLKTASESIAGYIARLTNAQPKDKP